MLLSVKKNKETHGDRENEKDFHHLSTNLARLMFENNLDAPELSRLTSVPTATINRLRANIVTNPTIASLLPIANFFSISLNQLIGTDEIPSSRIAGTFHPEYRNEKIIPLITLDQITKENKDIKSNYNDTISTSANITPKAFATRMNNLAMFPKFPEGTIFIVEPEIPPSDQDFVLVKIEDQKNVSIKQLFIDGDDHYFKNINPEFGRLVHSNKSEILGVIVEAIIKYER
jgi:transcriptional regulator with XRE-family HTH domain